MKEIFQEYGGILITVVAILAIIVVGGDKGKCDFDCGFKATCTLKVGTFVYRLWQICKSCCKKYHTKTAVFPDVDYYNHHH